MINSKELLKYTKDLTLLFVEDHEELRVNTTEILKNFFKKVDSSDNGVNALALYESNFEDNPYDIVITDIQMPKMNGVELTQKIYEINPRQSVIVLSAHDETNYLLPLINLGIEQFLKKPVDYQELLRILLNVSKKVILMEETKENSKEVHLTDNAIFNQETKILLQNEKNIYLTKYEIIFLEVLTQNSGKVYSNDNIVEYFHDINESIDPQNIRKLVSKLRKKLPENALESIYGVGYRIVPFYK